MNLTKIENILKYVLFGAIFVVPFIPFIVYGGLFFPFITGKAFAFRVLVELMVGLWAILALINPKYRIKPSWVIWLSSAFVLIIGLADILGENPVRSIWSNFERMEGWITLIHLFGYFVVTSAVLNTKKLWHRFFNTSIIASVGMGFYGVLQLAGKLEIHQGGDRLDATFGNASYLAVYMLIHIFLTLYFLAKRKNWSIVSSFYLIAVLLQALSLYHTATRGAILGLIGGLIIFALIIAIFEKEKPKLKKIAIGILTSLVLFVGLFVAFKDSGVIQDSPVLKRFANISLQETTTKSRFMVWGMAIEGFKENPILGWGQENFNYVFNKNYNPGMYAQEQWFDRTHNVFFDWLIAGGLLGLLGYLALFWVIIYYLIKDRNKHFTLIDKAIIVGLLTGYFIHNLFVFDNLISYIYFFSILGYIHTLNAKEFSVHKEIKPAVVNVVGGVIIVATVFCIYFVNWNTYFANKNLLAALMPYRTAEGGIDIDKNLGFYDKALAYESSVAQQEIREQFSQLGISLGNLALDPDTKQTLADLIYMEMEKQIVLDPQNARLEVLMGTFLASVGAYDMALPHFLRANELSPNKQQIINLIGVVFQNQEKDIEALEMFRVAYELDKNFDDAAISYAGAAINAGENVLAEEVLSNQFGTDLVYHTKITQAYYESKNYNKLVEILELHKQESPGDFQARVSLAATYNELGQKTKAVKEIQEMIDNNPDFREQGESFIKEIRGY